VTPTIHLVHVKDHPSRRPSKRWHYIGRDMTKVSPLYRASALGNPFRPAVGPGSSLSRYRPWLVAHCRSDGPQRAELLQILAAAVEPDGVCLACWCRDPESCHGTVVRDVVRLLWTDGEQP
jgi:hypothetical protein